MAFEGAHAGKSKVDQPVEELVHPGSAERDGASDRNALTELEVRDALLGSPHRRTLSRDKRHLLDRGVEKLDVDLRLADSHVDDDLAQAGGGQSACAIVRA